MWWNSVRKKLKKNCKRVECGRLCARIIIVKPQKLIT